MNTLNKIADASWRWTALTGAMLLIGLLVGFKTWVLVLFAVVFALNLLTALSQWWFGRAADSDGDSE